MLLPLRDRRSPLPVLLTLLALLALAAPARAFYWPPWPGSQGSQPDTFEPDLSGPPFVRSNPPVFPPGGGPPVDTPEVPEPATLVGGLIGVAAASGYACARRRRTARA